MAHRESRRERATSLIIYWTTRSYNPTKQVDFARDRCSRSGARSSARSYAAPPVVEHYHADAKSA